MFINRAAFFYRSLAARAIFNQSAIRPLVSFTPVVYQKDVASELAAPASSHIKHHDLVDGVPETPIRRSVRTEERGNVKRLENAFRNFEARVANNEIVEEKDFVQLFENFKESINKLDFASGKYKGDISLLVSTLLRCCGRLMADVAPKNREILLGDVWQFTKDSIDLDVSMYNNLIRSMIENQTQFDPEKILTEIQEKCLKPDAVTYQRLIHQYCTQGDVENATKLLETMKDLDFTLNENIFASLILGYGHQGKTTIKDMFDVMRNSGIEPMSKSYAAAVQVVTRLDDEAELQKLIKLIESEDIQLSVEDAIDAITALARKPQHEQYIKSIIKLLGNQTSMKRIIRTLLQLNLSEIASEFFWSRKPSQRAISNGNVGGFYIKLLVSTNTSKEFCFRECSKLLENGYNTQPYHTVYFHAAQAGKMDLLREAIKSIKDQQYKINHTFYWPLIAQAKNEKELIDVLKNEMSSEMRHSDLIETFSEWIWPKFSENFERLFELNKELKYNNGILVTSFLKYAVADNKMDDAIRLLTTKIPEIHEAVEDVSHDQDEDASSERTAGQGSERRSLEGSLLNQIAEQTRDPELVKKVFLTCLVPGRPVEQGLGMPIIKAHLLNNDFEGALESFFDMVNKYKITPRKSELIKYCLENKQPESLQRIIDVLTEVKGQSEALYDLALCCVEVKKLKQAQKIFTSPGFRVLPSRIFRTCTSYINRNQIEQLEDFVNIALNVIGIDQEGLYSILIEGYGRRKDGKKALDLYNRMQENEFQPSKKILLQLAGVLEQCGIDVPFQKPNLSVNETRNQNRY